MKKHFEKLFSKSKKVLDWLQGPIAKGIWFSVILLIILLISISKRLNGVSALDNIILGLCGIVTFYPFIALNLKHYLIKPLTKFLRQGTENPEELFKKFSHRAFLYGIIVYSFFTSFIIGCCIFAFGSIFNQKINFINWGFTLFFITSALFSILYFMYHISVNNISTKVIKARIRLYAAITGTITSFASLFGFSIKDLFFPLIIYLGSAFLWISFFVEKVESENEGLGSQVTTQDPIVTDSQGRTDRSGCSELKVESDQFTLKG